MPRKPRELGDGLHYHVIVRCNNKERLLSVTEFPLFLDSLMQYTQRMHVRVYDYALLQTHAHLLLSTHDGVHLDAFMRDFCAAFARDYMTRHGRAGHIWRDRYWSRVVRHDQYAICCMRYFSWNAPKAGLVAAPADWSWSGYRCYALGETNPLLEPHTSYLALGNTPTECQYRYREIVMTPLSADEEWLFREQTRYHSKRFEQRLMISAGTSLHRALSAPPFSDSGTVRRVGAPGPNGVTV